MPSILIGVDLNGTITQRNSKAEDMTGVSAEDAIGQLLKRAFPEMSAELKRVSEANTEPCEGAKIQQVLLNILSNGAQAMQAAGTKSPRLIVRTRFEKGRQMALMEIEDNGPGMDETTRKRVFEPFFTTKPVGVGTGLGLSVSYFIITENHGGEMRVESRPGTGAKFIIRLPLKGAAA
ncbi:MAG: PAS domain-containing protein [Deltaproteobacteria bacterium]|nr:PAS domain-containing protein [Deltaproteobacteria bacterium]